MKKLENQCRLCKLFSSPAKIRVLEELSLGERTVSEIVGRTGVPQSNVSQYLAAMKSQELLRARREGKFIHYSLAYPELGEALQLFRKIMEKKAKSR